MRRQLALHLYPPSPASSRSRIVNCLDYGPDRVFEYCKRFKSANSAEDSVKPRLPFGISGEDW